MTEFLIAIVLVCLPFAVYICIVEAWCEKDWPRKSMQEVSKNIFQEVFGKYKAMKTNDILELIPPPQVGVESGLFTLLSATAVYLWGDWSRDMKINTLNIQAHTFTMSGTCPHCTKGCSFSIFGGVGDIGNNKYMAAMQCAGCRKFLLVFVSQLGNGLLYSEHYPLGEPSSEVPAEIPQHIQDDYKEAICCLFIKAYNATAEMCRRALEASCIELGTTKKRLDWMIDELEEKRIITPALKNAAHKIRLGGNRGAHPPEDGPASEEDALLDGPIEKIEKEHAEAILDFTGHFFQHVYVIPKQLGKYDFSKPKPKTD